MNREKLAWTTSIVLMAILAIRLPGSLAQRDDDYVFVRTLVDIHRQVTGNYVEPVDEQKLRQAAIDGMLRELDPFTVYVPPDRVEDFDRMLEGSFPGVGIQLNERENGDVEVVTPIDGSPAFEAGVMAGDIIIRVNGESVENQRMTEVIEKIKGPLGSEVTLTVRRQSGDRTEEIDLTMRRAEVVVPTIKGFRRLDDNTWEYFISEDPKIGYVRITQFTPETTDKLKAILEELLAEGMQGLVLDVRFNPGGRLDEARSMIDLFIDEGVIVSVRGRNRERIERATGVGTLPHFPMIVLVNEQSASASEIVAGALKDHRRAVVIGTRTYGKGSVQEVVQLEPGSGELKMTVAYYYLPSGRLVHRRKDAEDWGVEPSIIVAMDPEVERQVFIEMNQSDRHHRPALESATQPTTRPTTQPVDSQLQRAKDTLLALLIMRGEG